MRNSTPARRRRLPLVIDCLEDRRLPAYLGLPWPDPSHLTLSFAPDGAVVGGTPSALFQTLGKQVGSSAWQGTVLRAFQTWSTAANINIGLVNDDGEPAGLPGPIQGKIGVGDVRISAVPLSSDTLALTTPFDLFNTWSGSVIFNSNAAFGDGAGGTQDLFGAALHEVGHILGLPDQSSDPTSVMYDVDLPGRTGISAADVAAVRALYGMRQSDTYEGMFGNDNLFSAQRLSYLNSATNAAGGAFGSVSVAEADITTAGDRDTYAVTIPVGTSTPATISVRTAGLSLLTPKVTVFDLLGQPVVSASTTDPLHNDVSVTIPALPGSTFYVRVEGAQSGVFGVGSYRIAAGSASVATAAAAPVSASSQGIADDGGRNDSLHRATTLRSIAPADDPRWTYSVRAGIAHSTDLDYYRFRTDNNTPPVALLDVGGMRAGGLTPRLDVFDSKGAAVPVQILSRGDASYAIQIPKLSPNTWYTVRVAAADPTGTHATGNYFLGIDLRSTAVPMLGFAEGALQGQGNSTVAAAQDFRTLTVNSTMLFHFDLSATGGGNAGDAAVRVVVYDAQAHAVFSTRTVTGGAAGAGDVLLNPGRYTIRLLAASRTGAPLPLLLYNLQGLIRTDPVGPAPVDTSLLPTGTGSGGPTDPSINPPDPTTTTKYLTLADPLSNPWSY